MILTFINNISSQPVSIEVLEVATWDRADIIHQLEAGNIVVISKAGGFILATPFERRVLNWVESGNVVIYPNGLVLSVTSPIVVRE